MDVLMDHRRNAELLIQLPFAVTSRHVMLRFPLKPFCTDRLFLISNCEKSSRNAFSSSNTVLLNVQRISWEKKREEKNEMKNQMTQAAKF